MARRAGWAGIGSGRWIAAEWPAERPADRRAGRWAAVACLLLALSACRAPQPVARPQEARGSMDWSRCVWVDRWDFGSPGDIRRVLGDCAAMGFRTVFFQVRGAGCVLYPSTREVWPARFGFRDPGFDPLRLALDEGRRLGIDVHPWVNLIPGWSGAEPPSSPQQLWQSRPDWFLRDAQGAREPLAAGRYVGLNPGLPDVRRYLAGLCGEIVQRYGVRGLHIDYVRFTDGDYGDGGPYPRDPQSLAQCRADGFDPSDAAAFGAWKRWSIQELVREVRRAVGSRIALTAAVLPDPAIARDRHFQEWSRWCEAGLVDAVVPMNYSADDGQFGDRIGAAMGAARQVPVIVGVGAYKVADGGQLVRQVEAAWARGAAGVGIFNYRTLMEHPDLRAAMARRGPPTPR